MILTPRERIESLLRQAEASLKREQEWLTQVRVTGTEQEISECESYTASASIRASHWKIILEKFNGH